MQQPYVQNGQFNQYVQQPQYGMPQAPTANQQQYAQPMPPPGQQQISNQSNTVQIPNQPGSQQPIIITQGGGKRKKKSARQQVLNALICLLAAILIVGVIALAVMSFKEKLAQANTDKAAEEAAKQNEGTKTPDTQEQYKTQNIDNSTAGTSLNTINQAQDKSQSL